MALDSKTRVLITPDDLIGYEIDGRYRLEAIVGGGGMGVVYRTTQRNLNRDIAIKLLKLEENEGDHRVDRFRREIDIVSQLSHPNIVHIFDSGCDDLLGLHYIAMELVNGVSLDELMRNNRVKTALAIDIAHEVAAALTEPHKLGIVHRDIKPANVLITVRSDDTVGVKVVDFGIARGAAKGGGSKITTTGVVVGSPMYMAPEVARGEQLDGRTDLYSMAVMLYEMITGATPFGGSTPVAIMLRHAVEEPPSMADSVPDDFAFPELVQLVDSMLSKERKHRPADAKAVMRRLDEIRTMYELPRPRVDASAPLRQAFSPYLVRHRMVGEATESGPYDVTLRLEEEPHSDTFSGWLVSSAARTRLHGGPESPLEAETAKVVPEKSQAWLVPVILVIAVAVAVLGAVVLSQGKPEATVQIGDPPPLVEAPVEVVKPDEPAAAPPTTAAQEVPDVGVVEDLGQPEPDVAIEEPVKVVRDKPAKPDKVETPKKKDDFNKGMEWLHKK